MEKRNQRKILITIVIVIMVFTASSYVFINNKEKERFEFYYEVQILSLGAQSNYTVVVPMPDFQKDDGYWNNLLLSQSIRIGNINVTTVNTTYGKGLMMNASYSCRFYIQLNESVPAESLTMNTIGSHYTIYTYVNNQSSFISIDVKMINFKFVNSNDKIGVSNSIHVYPAIIGWFEEYGAIIDTYP